MTILLLSPMPPPSGGIARWTQLYLDWCEEKHQILLVNTALVGNRAGEAGIKIKLIDEIKRACCIIKETKKYLSRQVNVFHLNTSCSSWGVLRDWVCTVLATKKNIPIIVHCHCNIEDQLGNNILAKRFFKKIVAKAQRVLVLNKSSQQYVMGIASEKVRICPNFVLPNQILDKHEVSGHLSKALYVGDARFSKGTDDIYKLADQLPNITFIIVGSVTEEVKSLSKPKNIILLGRLETEQIEEQLKNADVFIFPSLTEGFSNALLEAMAAGLPIVATDVGANRDMIEDKGGLIVDVHDLDAMKKALQIMNSTTVRQKMSDWNIRKVVQKYEYQSVLESLFEIYREVL